MIIGAVWSQTESLQEMLNCKDDMRLASQGLNGKPRDNADWKDDEK